MSMRGAMQGPGARFRRAVVVCAFALAACLAAGAQDSAPQTTGGDLLRSDTTAYAGGVTNEEIQGLQRRLAAAMDPVERQVIKVELAAAQAREEFTRLRRSEAQERAGQVEAREQLVRMRLSVYNRVRDLATVGDCRGLLAYMRKEDKDLTAAERQAEQASAELQEQVRLTEVEAEQAGVVRQAAGEGTLAGLPPLAQWGAPGERFLNALATLEQARQAQLKVMGDLKVLADGRLASIRDSRRLIAAKRADVAALKDQLFWRPEPIPYNAATVEGAARDLSGLVAGLADLVMGLPAAAGKVADNLRARRLLLQLAGGALLAMLGALLLAAGAPRARRRADAWILARMARPMTLANRIEVLLLRCVRSEAWFWLAPVLLAAAWLLLATLQQGWPGTEGRAVAAGGFGPYRMALALALTWAVIAGFRLARGLVRNALYAPNEAERLVNLHEPLAGHVRRCLALLLWTCVVLLVPIAVLSSMDYNPAFVSLLWQVLRVLVFVGILLTVARRGLLERVFRQWRTPVGGLVHRVAQVAYPAAVAGVLLLIVFRSVGFAAPSRSVVIVALEGALGLSLIWLVFWRGRAFLNQWADQLSAGPAEHSWLGALGHLLRLARWLSGLAGLVLAAVFAWNLLTYHYGTAVFSPHAPAGVRATAERTRHLLQGAWAWAQQPVHHDSHMTPVSLLLGGLIVLAAVLCSGMMRRGLNRQILSRTHLDLAARDTLSSVIAYLAVGLAILVGLNVSGLPLAGVGIFAGASGLAIGFGMQAILSNFVSGLIIMIERHVKAGDCVKVGEDLVGYVERINVRSTTVQTFDNYRVVIPNSEFVEQRVINWSTQDPKLRLNVDVGIAYGSDTESAREGLLKVARDDPDVLADPAPDVKFSSFGDNALIFRLQAWVPDVSRYYGAISNLHFAIDREFRERGIEIAFPQRDLHLRSVDPQAARALGRAFGRAAAQEEPENGGKGAPGAAGDA